MNEPIYLDNAATTAVCPAAEAAFLQAAKQFGNPSSLHALGFAAERLVAEARASIAAGLGAEPGELIFTPGGTYADNFAILGAARRSRKTGGCRGHIITSAIEHDAVLNTVAALEKEGFEITRLMPDASGHIAAEDVAAAVRADTVLVSLMLVNNELGTVQPVAEAARLVKRIRPDILVHTDAVQAYRKMPVNVRTLGVDLLSLSGHKIHACKGIGALYVRKGVRLAPVIYGGGQEKGIAPGTEPVPLIAALAAAASQPLAAETLNRLKDRPNSARRRRCFRRERPAGSVRSPCAASAEKRSCTRWRSAGFTFQPVRPAERANRATSMPHCRLMRPPRPAHCASASRRIRIRQTLTGLRRRWRRL